jgi:uncharacterized iron-regulated protein
MDLLRAEPIHDRGQLWKDLSAVDVIYIGETHRLERHHREQVAVFKELANRNPRVILGLEQLERRDQAEIDRFNSGEVDFRTLADAINWKSQWANYEDYRGLMEAAFRSGARIIGLNAPRQIIRKIGRSGIDSLDSAERRALAKQLHFDDPVYRRLMDRIMLVHASLEASDLKNVFQAQVARDETMAETLTQAVEVLARKGEKPVAIVLTGFGHVRFGLGVPDRVQRRLPRVMNRILLMSESGDLVLTAAERAASRNIEISHEILREVGRSVGDYLYLAPYE